APFDCATGSFLINDQRPANSMLAKFVLRRRFPSFRPKVGRLFDGTSSERKPSKLSEVTKPSAASSESASSTCDESKPVRRTISAKNKAPPASRASRADCAFEESSLACPLEPWRMWIDLVVARQSHSSKFSR